MVGQVQRLELQDPCIRLFRKLESTPKPLLSRDAVSEAKVL